MRVVLRSIYWLVEFEKFGLAARPKVESLLPEIIHAHDLATLPIGGSIALKIGAKLVYDSHELEMHRNSSYPWLVWRWRHYLERNYIRRADAVITVSDSIADHLKKDYKIDRPVVIMNAPDLENHSPPGRSIRNVIGLGSDDILAVYVGSVTINRGLDLCVRALIHVPEVHLALVGPRRKATEDEILSLARDLGVRDRLYLIDPVKPNEIVSFISDANLSVLPIQNVCLSYYYCMPNKLLESVFAGLPVAVADLFELRRFVEKYGCGLVMDQTDPEDIARKIRQLATERETYRLSGEMLATLKATYSWSSRAAAGLLVEQRYVYPEGFLIPAE